MGLGAKRTKLDALLLMRVPFVGLKRDCMQPSELNSPSVVKSVPPPFLKPCP